MEITEPRFILFGGKGGVGKTVCSAGAGAYLAQLGKRTLVYSVNPAHSLSDCFSHEIGGTTTKVAENLYALEVDAKKLLDDLKRTYREDVDLSLRSLVRPVDLPFERELLMDLMDLAPPGLDELMALTNLVEIDKKGDYDSIVVDMAAGAHAVRLLGLPKPLESWISAILRLLAESEYFVGSARLRSLLEGLREGVAFLEKELSDPEKALFIPVTTPESLATLVARDIVESVRSSHVPVRYVVVNQVVQTSPTGCRLCDQVREQQSEGLANVRRSLPDIQAIIVPALPEPVRGQESVKTFAGILVEGRMPDPDHWAARRGSREPMPVRAGPRLPIPSRRLALLVFVGKGGCGKTTSAAAMALRAADAGRRTLIFSTDPQRSLSEVFEQPIGESVVAVRGTENLWAFQISAEKLYRRFVEEHGKEIAEVISSATYVRESDVMQFLELSLPGVDEVMAFLKLIEVARDEERNYDLIVVDTAPTGHTLRLLEMPALLSSWLRLMLRMRSKSQFIAGAFFGRAPLTETDRFLSGMLAGIRRIDSLLKSQKSKFVPVTVAEPMAVAEIERLISFLGRHGLAIQAVVVNRVIPPGAGCDYCATRSDSQLAVLRDFEGSRGEKVVTVPLFPYEIMGPARLREFASALVG